MKSSSAINKKWYCQMVSIIKIDASNFFSPERLDTCSFQKKKVLSLEKVHQKVENCSVMIELNLLVPEVH